MTQVYQAGTLVEAQLVADELTQAGIDCVVTGQFLSGAIGELPPTDVLGVKIQDAAEEQRARRLIAEWELSRKRVRDDWFCRSCGERVGGAFGICWQCGEPEIVD